MRIDGQTNFSIEKISKGAGVERSTDAFSNMLYNSRIKLHHEALNRLVELVEFQGQKLIKHRTVENYRDYKIFP